MESHQVQSPENAISARNLLAPSSRVKTADTIPQQNQAEISRLATPELPATQSRPDLPKVTTRDELVSTKQNDPFTDPSPLDLTSFPNQPRAGYSLLPGTVDNTKHLLNSYGITTNYDVIKKKLRINIPGYQGTPDNAEAVAMTYIVSLAALNGLPIGQIYDYVAAIGDRTPSNPAMEWITSKPWDGKERLQAFSNTLTEEAEFPKALKEILLKRWIISAVAAAMKPLGFKTRGVLTLQGPQSIGKTSWIAQLVGSSYLRELLIKLDHHLDAANKDSILTAVSHWIVEIGELDSSFKKDIARLKGFLTNDKDKLRRPYGRADSEYQRRTVFCATVNEHGFLVDPTGNSRWWTIPVTRVDYDHKIDMQQLFAQMAVEYQKGEQWWLTPQEEQWLDEANKAHRTISVIQEQILGLMDLKRKDDKSNRAMTPTELLIQLGIKNPSNAQAKECAAVLREHLGESKRVGGRNVWRIPLGEAPRFSATTFEIDDDDLY
jgi:putative DNA primase/helicase